MSENPLDSAQTEPVALTDGNTAPAGQEMAAIIREKISVSWWFLGGVLLTSFFFLYCSYLPVYHTDIWGHVSYGTWILEHGSLPTEDPFVLNAGGVELVDNAWLSQVMFGWLAQQFGPQGLSDGYAVFCLAMFLSLIAAFSIRAQSWGIGFFSAAGVWGMIIFRLAIVRPELLGGFCFALLFVQVACVDRLRSKSENGAASLPRWAWVSIPLTFALWTNLHGSYIIGFAVLGCAVLGSAIEALVRHRTVLGTWRDRNLRADLIVLELSLLAACLNPYGIDLLLQTVLFPSHPNLKSVMEWFPLEIMSLEGIPMAMSWVVAAFAIRHSKVKFSVRDVLLLLVMNLAVCLRVRMIAWYAPVYFFVLAPHFANSIKQITELKFFRRCDSLSEFLSKPSFHAAAITGLICFLAFSFAPVSRHSMGGAIRPDKKILSQQTPLDLTQYFAEHPPEGVIYAPQWWGDWLIWKSNNKIDVFVSTNTIHLVPESVWQHYLTISKGRPGAERLLHRYRINTMVVSKDLQPGLEKMMLSRTGWKSVYADDISVVFQRTSETESKQGASKTAH